MAHPVDRLFSYKGNIAAIETENGLTYYQYLRYKEPTEIHIKGETSVKMGTTEKYSISSDGLLTPTCTWTSSNPEIVNAAAHYLKGDTNCDGVITITDVTVLQKYLANIVNFDEKQLAAADVDGDGSVTIADGTQIQKYLANIVTSLG